MVQRYEELELSSALSRRHDYAQACFELSLIVQKVLPHAPESLQKTIYDDLSTAISFLPHIETNEHTSAIQKLAQALEGAIQYLDGVILNECTKILETIPKDGVDLHHLPNEKVTLDCSNDILIHIFGFLDAKSLGRTASVCRSWNMAANNESLWETVFKYNFGDPTSRKFYHKQRLLAVGKALNTRKFSWKELFQITARRYPMRWFSSNRAFCSTCDTFVWINGTHSATPVCPRYQCRHHKLKPLTPVQVMQLLWKDSLSSSSSSSSDSDTDSSAYKFRFAAVTSNLKRQPHNLFIARDNAFMSSGFRLL